MHRECEPPKKRRKSVATLKQAGRYVEEKRADIISVIRMVEERKRAFAVV